MESADRERGRGMQRKDTEPEDSRHKEIKTDTKQQKSKTKNVSCRKEMERAEHVPQR